MSAPLVADKPVTTARVRARALGWLVMATACWGLSFPLGKAAALGLEQAAPAGGPLFAAVFLIAWRFALGALALSAIFGRAALAIGPRELWHGGALAALCGGGLAFQMIGLQTIDASVSAFLTQAGVALAPLYAALDKRRWPARRIWLALVVMLAGASALSGVRWGALGLGQGEALTLIGAALFAGQVYWLERDDFRAVRPLPTTLAMFLFLAVGFAVALPWVAPSWDDTWRPLLAPGVLWPVLGLTAFCSVVAFTLMNRWQPRVSAAEAAVVYGLESVFASAYALFLPALLSAALGLAYANETLSWRLVVGGGLILGAYFIVSLPAGRGEPSAPRAAE